MRLGRPGTLGRVDMSDFTTLVERFIDEFFRLEPTRATSAGMHAHDHRWPDASERGRLARLAFAERWLTELAGLADATLTPDERIDRDLLAMELAAARFRDTGLREESWDPLAWIYLLGDGIYPLLAREFAPAHQRLASVAARLDGMPAVIEEAKLALAGHGSRPISRLHTETALRQVAGVIELIDEAETLAEDGVASGVDGPSQGWPALRTTLAAAGTRARAALASFETFLRNDVLPRSEGEGRLGAELFRAKMRHTLKSDRSPEQILTRAREEFDLVRGEMIRLATAMWPEWVPERPLPTPSTAASAAAADREIVRTVLDRIGRIHPVADDLLAYCREELGRIEAFVATHRIIDLVEEPLEIRWTPAFLRAFGGAMLDPPGPLDRGQKSFFSITPMPADWTAEQVESSLREMNDRQLRLLTIHEAVPGHYLQGAYANRCPSIVRAIFWSGVFAEGWAVYVTQVMMDQGYDAGDPALLLNHWKYYLRAVANAIIDVQIHAGSMTEVEAMELMVNGAFQEQSEAANKWNRARLTSTQLATYFVGSMEMWELELEGRRRAAIRAGDPRGAAAVPAARIVGNHGATPGFDYKAHLEAVISHGSPPPILLRRILFG